MSAPRIKAGDEITAVVTHAKPFGVFVEFDGTPGLVRGVQAAVGDVVRVRVIEYDAANDRFSAAV